MTDPLKPSLSLLSKLGSIAVHAEEMLSPKGHHFDKLELEQLLKDPEIKKWIDAYSLDKRERRADATRRGSARCS